MPATNASLETRAFLAAVLSLDALLPSEAERVEITRNLEIRMIRQRDGRKAAALARDRRKKGNPMGGVGFGKKAHYSPRNVLSLSKAQQDQARDLFLAGQFATMAEIAKQVGCSSKVLLGFLSRSGLRERPPHKQIAAEGRARGMAMVPPDCITTAELRERLGMEKGVLMGRLKRRGIKPAGRASNVFWYAEADLRAAGFLP